MSQEHSLEAADGLLRLVNLHWKDFPDIKASNLRGNDIAAMFDLEIGDSQYVVAMTIDPLRDLRDERPVRPLHRQVP